MRAFRNSVVELFTPATAVTVVASTDLKQGQFVTIAGKSATDHPLVKVAEPGGYIFGIVATDVKAGELVGLQRGHSRCFRLPTAGGVSAGSLIEVGADGKPTAHQGGVVVGMAIHSSDGDTVDLTLI